MTKLSASYGRWYWHKCFNRSRQFLRQLDGYRMYLNLDDPGISTTLGRGGAREKEHTKILSEELKPDMVVWDIGANFGYYALMEAAMVGPTGKIYAVEPVPGNYQFLVKNVALNHFADRIETFQMAISDIVGTQSLFLSRYSNLNTLFQQDSRQHQGMSGETIEVKTMDVKTFLADKRPIDLIRMDIEGSEVEVLNGLVQVFDQLKKKPKILFETHPPKYHESHSLRKPLESLMQKGYYVKYLVSNSDDGTKWRDLGYQPFEIIATDGTTRGIYSGIKNEDAVHLLSQRGGVRAVLLASG